MPYVKYHMFNHLGPSQALEEHLLTCTRPDPYTDNILTKVKFWLAKTNENATNMIIRQWHNHIAQAVP